MVWAHRTVTPQVHSHTSEHMLGWLNQEPNLELPVLPHKYQAAPATWWGRVPASQPGPSQPAGKPLLTILGRDIKVSYDEAATLFCICWTRPSTWSAPASLNQRCHQGAEAGTRERMTWGEESRLAASLGISRAAAPHALVMCLR